MHQGEIVLERLRKKIEAHSFMCDGAPLRVTMTFGMVCRGVGESLDEAIKRADMAMYTGKRQGRNRVLSS
jgi:GGDEF domain-containing protein